METTGEENIAGSENSSTMTPSSTASLSSISIKSSIHFEKTESNKKLAYLTGSISKNIKPDNNCQQGQIDNLDERIKSYKKGAQFS